MNRYRNLAAKYCGHANISGQTALIGINISVLLIGMHAQAKIWGIGANEGNKQRIACFACCIFMKIIRQWRGPEPDPVPADMSPTQCLKARTLLNWTPADLARAAGVSVIIVKNFEAGKVASGRLAARLMKRAL